MSSKKIVSIANIFFVLSIVLMILIVVITLGSDFNSMLSKEIVKVSLYTSYMKVSCFLFLALGLFFKWWNKTR